MSDEGAARGGIVIFIVDNGGRENAMTDEAALGLTTLGLIVEMESQLNGGHNAGRSVTRVTALTAVVEMRRLWNIEQRAKAFLAKREDAAALAVRRGVKPRSRDGVNFMLRSILGEEESQTS